MPNIGNKLRVLRSALALEIFRFRPRNAVVQTARNISERRKLNFNLPLTVHAILLASLFLCLSLCACAPVRSPVDIVNEICLAEAGIPAGELYFSEAPEGSESFLPPELLSSAYGIPFDFEGIESAAVRLSANGHPFEVAVFLCKDAGSAEDVALFCRSRIKVLLRNSLFTSDQCGMSREDYEDYLSGASVTVSGRHVALIISSDQSRARRIFIGAV